MSLSSRVAWTEGLFLRPQHFQQEARFGLRAMDARWTALYPNAWGFSELAIDTAMLELGKIGLDRAKGIFPDGEIFDIPEHDLSPTPVEPLEDAHGCTVFLCLQPRRFGDRETSLNGTDTRLRTESLQVDDLSSDARTDAAPVEISRLQSVIRIEKKPGKGISGYICVPMARIADIAADGAIKLEENFIPSISRHGVGAPLASFVANTLGFLEGRAERLAARVTGASTGGAAETTDFILLQTINKYLPIFRHMVALPSLHPQELFMITATMCGEFAAYTRPDRITPEFAPYDHRNLTDSFRPVIDETRRCLSYIGDPTATEIPLTERSFGIRVAEVQDRTLLESTQFVLAVGASMPGEDVRRRFPKEAKIGSVEVIRDLVNVQLPGVTLIALPVAPRQIPYHAGKVYFELERKGDYWESIKGSAAIALHVGGNFPGLNLTLWAIREIQK